jgi:cathepsin F
MCESVIKLVLLVLLITSSYTQTSDDEKQMQLFLKFIKEYDKTYISTTEMIERFEIFKNNISKLNLDQLLNDSSDSDSEDDYSQGITEFSDMTDEEFQNKLLRTENVPKEEDLEDLEYFDPQTNGSIPSDNSQEGGDFLSASLDRNLQTIPASFDWRSRRAITLVKYQGICGVCWAFATTSVLESLYFIKFRKYVTLSEQQLLDCNTENNGCYGGDVKIALKYIMSNGGIQSDTTYPYITKQGNCKYDPTKAIVRVEKFIRGSKDEEELKRLVYSVGPVTVTMNATYLKDYKRGIYSPTVNQCNPNVSNHVVVLIGYGTASNGVPFWIVKNSWGTKWGEAGFFRIPRGTGVCGINRYAVTAVLQ